MTVKIPDGLPWFLSGIRFKMNGGNWQSINRYDENKKQDENIALVGYDTRTGGGRTDALYIVHAANSYPALVEALKLAREFIENGIETGYIDLPDEPDPALKTSPAIRAALKAAGEEP